MISTLSESKFLLAILPEPLSPGRSGNAQTSDNFQHSASQLHLLARCRKEFAINLGVNFCQILIRSLITINQEATAINRNNVHTFLRLKLLYDRSCDTNIRATGFSRSRCRIVVIDIDVFCIRTIIIKMMLLTISTQLVPSLHIIDRLIITQRRTLIAFTSFLL